jgi:hypothetical protein
MILFSLTRCTEGQRSESEVWLQVLQMLLIPCSIRNNLLLLMVGSARRVSSHQGTAGQMGSSPAGRYNSTAACPVYRAPGDVSHPVPLVLCRTASAWRCQRHWTRRDAGCMLAPLVAARTTAHPDGTRGHIHPPHNLARDAIDIHAIPKSPRMEVRGTPIEG